jgi:uncharacterized protein YjbI with pentapeptide repeats
MPVDYYNQDITNIDLSGQDLSGGNFTNTIATGVNFTNANITNAIFKNTLITGANISTLTFSGLQKGYLLLRAANHGIAAVNNLTTLTVADFRVIQPAVGADTIARISTVTVKIPNSQGEGYTVSVTPVISQLVCIFVATNQNIIITTGVTQIRTIRSNGTVVQDVSNVNTTLNYLKIDSISYRLTVGNGDGVIAMIPVDLNVYQVNGSGLGDIVSLNVGSASTTLNMNNNGITSVSSIQGWNVKEITAGTGIGVTATNGSYAITNSAVVRDISAGTGITVSTAGGVATITNSAVVRDISAGTGITVSTAGGVATITNSAVVRDISAGTGITVSTTGGVATITNSAVVRDISVGTGITVSKTGGVATLQNSGILSVGAASGTPGITVSTVSGVATLQNTGILSVGAASGTPGITVSTVSGVATLQNTGILSVGAASGTPGITVSTASGVATLQNTGILSVASGTGISVGTSNGIATITNTLTNDVVLWYSATPYFTSQGTYNLVWETTRKIDLTQYNIRYEIDINFDYLASQSTAASHIQLGLNSATSTFQTLPSGTTNKVHSVTNWTNIINDGGSGTAQEYNQTYRNRFYCGYRPPSTWTADYRNKLRLSGEISYNRRTTSDPGISPDHSANSREIINRYTSDHILITRTTAANNDEWYVHSNPAVDTPDQHHRIHGTSIWNASAGYLWTANEGINTALSQGINNISLAFQDVTTPTTTYARPAEVNYRIWRVKK